LIDTATIERYMRDANPIPHVDDLDPDEFARFVAAADKRRAAIMQAPTQHETTEPHPTTSQPSRSRRAWAFAAAFILILASIGIAALVLRGDGATVTDEPAPPTTIAETPDEPVGVESLTWSRIPHDEAVFDDEGNVGAGFIDSHVVIHDATTGGPGLVAVGEAGGDAAVWTSADGYTWSRVPHDESTFGGTYNSAIRSVTEGGPGLVAVGYSEQVLWHPALEEKEDWSGDELEALGIELTEGGSSVWTSADGYTWSRIDFDEGSQTGGLEYVTVGSPGLIALGGDTEGAVGWTSTDGLTWKLTESGNFAFNGSSDDDGRGFAFDGSPSVVIAGGPGFVGVGGGWDAGYSYTSSDGTTWSQSQSPLPLETRGEVLYVTVDDMTTGGPGFVAVGYVVYGEWGEDAERLTAATVWTSTDGYRWSLVPLDVAVFGDSIMTGVAATETGLVAIGTVYAGEWQAELQAAVWTSPDGITWSRAPLEEDVGYAQMNSITAGGPGFVAVGSFPVATGHEDPSHRDVGAVWIAEP
jgi:hypothetical protein